jgi:triosephosphate isomerase
MRTKFVAANWKMNKTMEEVKRFFVDFDLKKIPNNVDVIICVPYIYLDYLGIYAQNTSINIGAQDVSQYISGAYTGEISAQMLSSINITYCIVGHSERRKFHNETDELISKKIDRLLENKVKPIFCCGEVLEERNNLKQFEVVKKQIQDSLFHLTENDISKIIIAYEPVWAIGTGLNASNEQAQEMHKFIRDVLKAKFGENISQNIRILYGGSCNPSNAKELFSCEDVDGGLIGGASLKPNDFIQVINSANE